ncbi:Sec34-domain-containing protein [Parathielavia hyrcaniae]|uniref:Conserved oligomeric Golgi complex subunit 3 n=1 Tax=Parathielavia hyrcaniae TaxID=113614 RepID=A0AAN6SZN9_9PEZI|nr:Sec34-domain-containing protein [Parathielavia hyrcaniae]
MYEDSSWYSFVPELQHWQPAAGPQSTGGGHRRKQSLLQQPNNPADDTDAAGPLPAIFEDKEDANWPPEPTLSRRAKSYSDFYDIVKAQLSSHDPRRKRKGKRSARSWEALAIPESVTASLPAGDDGVDDALDKGLLLASQQDYLIYHDELAMTERHLGTLIADANSALKTLESLCQSFRAVDEQTSSFQAQCDGLLTEKTRLEALAESVGRDLRYYTYLDSATRRLNAPGAGRLVEGASFVEILSTLDACIEFMTENSSYRDAESYLARYQALLTKALHLLEVGFVNHLNKVSAEMSRQISATQSESARHALAYGRFEAMVLESYSLIPNLQTVVRNAYDLDGQPSSALNADIYANTANNLFHSYWAARERDLKVVIQHDLDVFRAEAKESIETACRNFVKQCFERSYHESSLFRSIFSVDAHYSTDPNSVFAVLKSQRTVLTGANVAPIATNLQSVLQTSDLQTICNLVGWITHEYLLPEYDEDNDTPFAGRSRELAARLLAEHLWAFTDAVFEAEITKSVTKAVVPPDAFKIGPATNGDVASNAFAPVKRALQLLVLFDQSMPKERCQRNSPVIFKIIKESMASVQRAEARIRSTTASAITKTRHAGTTHTDPDLFTVKNLLVLKNELVTLEIGDVRGAGADGGSISSRVWDAVRHRPQDLIGGLLSGLGNFGYGLGAYMPSIPGSSLWVGTPAVGSGGGGGGGGGVGAGYGGGGDGGDAGEQLDGLLRQSIVAFTRRWAGLLNEARGVAAGTELGGIMMGGRNAGKVERELDEMLERAFGGQPEVVGKLKEAIQIEAEALVRAVGEKRSHVTRV